MACSVIYVGGNCMESKLLYTGLYTRCKFSNCSRQKVCTQCLVEEAIYKNNCGHVFCKSCLCKLDTCSGSMNCKAHTCDAVLCRSDVQQILTMADSILVWRYISFPKYQSCNVLSVNCTGKPILTLKSCNHSYCFACTNILKNNNYEELIAEHLLICVGRFCKTIIPAAVLENYLISLQQKFALTAITLELCHEVCYKCRKNEETADSVLLRNRYCALHHAFCVKCIQDIQRNRYSETYCDVMGTDIIKSQMRCFVSECSVKTPMTCINIMLDVILGNESVNMVDVFIRKPDIGEKCDTCFESSAFVTRLVCSHALCLKCTEIIAKNEEERYQKCNNSVTFCRNMIPTRIFRKVLESSPAKTIVVSKQTTNEKGKPKVFLAQEIQKNNKTADLKGKISSMRPVNKPKWVKDDKELMIPNISDKYEEKCSHDFSELSQAIHDLNLEDERQCLLLVGNDQKEDAFKKVDITMPADFPTISLHKREEIDESVTVFLIAHIKYPIAVKTTRWQQDGKDLHIDGIKYRESKTLQTHTTLQISDLQESDEGQYQLIAECFLGENSSNAVSVHLPGEKPTITLMKESVNDDEKRIALKATIESMFPIIKCYWQKDGRDILITASSSKYEEKWNHFSRELFILEPKESDSGYYKYFAKNAIGEGEIKEIKIDLKKEITVLSVEMKLLENNKKLQITGHVSTLGSAWDIVWIKDNEVLNTTNFEKIYTSALLRSGNTRLVILDLNKEDEGEYKMQAKSVDGCFESQPVTFIIPKEIPKVTIETDSTESGKRLTAHIVSSWPIQKIEWLRNDSLITVNSEECRLESSCGKNVFNILRIKDSIWKKCGRYKVFVKTVAGENQSETNLTCSGKDVVSNFSEDINFPSMDNSTKLIPAFSNVKEGTCSTIALIPPPYDNEKRCILCEKTAVAEIVNCTHRYCMACIQKMSGISQSLYMDCILGDCPSYLRIKDINKLFDCPFTIQIQMPMHFEIPRVGLCQELLCIERGDFTIMPCKHTFCTDCLHKCTEKSECQYKYCQSKQIPAPKYFNNLFTSLQNEKAHPFLLRRNEASSAGYMTSNAWICLTYNCRNQADFVIIRCGHTFCSECGMKMGCDWIRLTKFKPAKCLVDKCKEIFPLPSFLQSTRERPTTSESVAVSKSEDGYMKNKSDTNHQECVLHVHSTTNKRKGSNIMKTAIKRFKPMPSRGLRNIGLSCYRNGVLQILAETPDFLENLHDSFPQEDANWISSLYSVLKGIRDQCTMEKDTVDCLHAFHHYFNQSHEGFQEYQQDDTLSFLTSVLNGIEDAHSAISKSKDQKRNLISPSNLFKGQLRDKYTCKKCKHIEYFNESNFFSLPPSVDSNKKEVTIGSCFVQLLKEEQVELPCSKCDSCDVSKEMEIETFPKILILQICKVEEVASSAKKRRFEKAFTKCRFWGDFKGLTTKELKRKSVASSLKMYRLYGVVVHRGSERGGHYFCFVKRKEDQIWNKCDDSYVVDSDLKNVLDSDAYLLFYERFETSD
ncbi:uncharacterized protein LOC134242464 isoform X4 [Saccostrea cucullata]|uniref:uncharacterized protein LOC134242464 isoform X4 n=1 Tax=Saccostrea cuccullata TaxID=36930 RepID=UPI002ED3E660